MSRMEVDLRSTEEWDYDDEESMIGGEVLSLKKRRRLVSRGTPEVLFGNLLHDVM